MAKTTSKGCLIVLLVFAGIGVLGICSCFAYMVYDSDRTAVAQARAKASEPKISPEQKKKQWAFIQKNWMTGSRALFYSVQDKGGGLVEVKADLRWYTASLDEKSLACESIWGYYFKGNNEDGGVWVEDARSGKHLATFSKIAGLQMEN